MKNKIAHLKQEHLSLNLERKEEFLSKYEDQRMIFENQLNDIVKKHKVELTALENKATRETQDLIA